MIAHGIWSHECRQYTVAIGNQSFAIERSDQPNLTGAIARGTVDRVLPGDRNGSRQAFVKLPGGATGFLQGRGLQPGQEKLVQVAGWVGDGKAWPLTAELKLPGRSFIHLPHGNGMSVSKNLSADQAALLSAELAAMSVGGGWIIRSGAALERPDARQDEALRLVANAGPLDAPGKDWLVAAPSVIDRVALDDHDNQRQALDPASLAERMQPLLQLDLPLSGGGRIRLCPTPALLAIDVDGGTADNPATLGQDAAVAILQAIRTRALAGQIVIDPVRGLTTKALLAGLKELIQSADRLTVHGTTRLGLIELSRPRTGPSLFEVLS